MGETEYLKAKCNALIDKALQNKKELEEIEQVIKKLEEEKESILMRLEKAESGKAQGENTEGKIAEKFDENHLYHEQFTVSFNQILQKMNELSAKIDTSGIQKEVIKLSPKEKTRQLLQDYMMRLGKFLCMLAVMGVLSLLATILLDTSLRNMLIELLKECIR